MLMVRLTDSHSHLLSCLEAHLQVWWLQLFSCPNVQYVHQKRFCYYSVGQRTESTWQILINTIDVPCNRSLETTEKLCMRRKVSKIFPVSTVKPHLIPKKPVLYKWLIAHLTKIEQSRSAHNPQKF